MDAATFQTDRILLTVFVSVVVGFITAALSIVRLVNDKENKTTDYRQAWVGSLRKSLADLISNISLLAGAISGRMLASDHANVITEYQSKSNSDELPDRIENQRAFLDNQLRDDDARLHHLWRDLYQSYALTRLHFKPNDLSFSRVEQKFDVVIEMLRKLQGLNGLDKESERMVVREKIHAAANDISEYSRDIIKTEWEAVKKGERAYQRTTFWSNIGGGLALIILVGFGVATTWSLLRASNTDPVAASPAVSTTKPEFHASSGASAPTGQPIAPGPPQNSQVVNVYAPPVCSTPPKRLAPTSRPASQSCP